MVYRINSKEERRGRPKIILTEKLKFFPRVRKGGTTL